MMCRVFGVKFALLQILMILVCWLQLDGTSAQTQTSRIVGGVATNIGEVPYLVQLQINKQQSCGGTIISARTVVTAAHCVKGVRPRSLTIIAGATKLNQRGVRRRVTRIAIPKAFNLNLMNMDVAVLRLSSPLPLSSSKISALPLCNSNSSPGDTVRVSGWGLTSESASGLPNTVRTVQLPLISKKKCVQEYGSRARLTKSMFCASRRGKDSCSGDSGGTVEYKKQFCGIVSWGIGCARPNYPGVYTNVNWPKVKNFIKRNMV